MTNFDLTEYEKDIAWLTNITQVWGAPSPCAAKLVKGWGRGLHGQGAALRKEDLFKVFSKRIYSKRPPCSQGAVTVTPHAQGAVAGVVQDDLSLLLTVAHCCSLLLTVAVVAAAAAAGRPH